MPDSEQLSGFTNDLLPFLNLTFLTYKMGVATPS